MTIRIEVEARQVYGETKFYPTNEAARQLALIAGTRTLTPDTLRQAKAMGCTVALDAGRTLEAMIGALPTSAASWFAEEPRA